MESALVFTHDRHKNQTMKKVPKLAKVADVDPSEFSSPYVKRKSMSLNQDIVEPPLQGGGGHLSMRTLTISSLSRDERRGLRKKLKLDLSEVKRIVRMIEARQEHLLNEPDMDRMGMVSPFGGTVSDRDFAPQISYKDARSARQSSSIVTVAPLSDHGTSLEAAHPLSKGNRKSKGHQMYLNLETPNHLRSVVTEKVKPKEASGGKKPGHVSSGGKKAGHGLRVGRPKGGMDLMKQCSTLLKKVMSHKHAWVFNKPVNAEELGILDYHTVIKKPMDLGTVKKKLESGHYPDPIGFAEDVRLTFFNAMSYNPQGHDVYIMASTLAAAFEKLWKGIAGKLQQHRGDAGGEVVQEEERLLSDNPGLPNDRVEKTRPTLPRKREMPVARTVVQSKPESVDIVKRPMTFEEKEKLSKQMESLPEDKLIHVIQIMRKRHPEIGEDNEEVEVDIESIDNETLWELERFISNYVKSKEKKSKMIPRRNQEASQPPSAAGEEARMNGTGGEPGEENVDIDDDLAPTQFAPVEIDKDGGADGEGSSSGDSRDSGSSSSDSDSDSSSGSESEAEDVQGGNVAAKATPHSKV